MISKQIRKQDEDEEEHQIFLPNLECRQKEGFWHDLSWDHTLLTIIIRITMCKIYYLFSDLIVIALFFCEDK